MVLVLCTLFFVGIKWKEIWIEIFSYLRKHLIFSWQVTKSLISIFGKHIQLLRKILNLFSYILIWICKKHIMVMYVLVGLFESSVYFFYYFTVYFNRPILWFWKLSLLGQWLSRSHFKVKGICWWKYMPYILSFICSFQSVYYGSKYNWKSLNVIHPVHTMYFFYY
jgi:hypothetical protein